jgi:hypothetical protein
MEWIKAPNVKEGTHPRSLLSFISSFLKTRSYLYFHSLKEIVVLRQCVCVKGKEDVWESKGFFFFTRQLGETIFQDPQRRHSLYLRYSLSWIKSCALLFCFN